MAPAHVPQTGFDLTNSLSGSRTPERRASNAMVVLSIDKQSQLNMEVVVVSHTNLLLG